MKKQQKLLVMSATAGCLVVPSGEKKKQQSKAVGSESKIYVEPFSLHSCALSMLFFNFTSENA